MPALPTKGKETPRGEEAASGGAEPEFSSGRCEPTATGRGQMPFRVSLLFSSLKSRGLGGSFALRVSCFDFSSPV